MWLPCDAECKCSSAMHSSAHLLISSLSAEVAAARAPGSGLVFLVLGWLEFMARCTLVVGEDTRGEGAPSGTAAWPAGVGAVVLIVGALPSGAAGGMLLANMAAGCWSASTAAEPLVPVTGWRVLPTAWTVIEGSYLLPAGFTAPSACAGSCMQCICHLGKLGWCGHSEQA